MSKQDGKMVAVLAVGGNSLIKDKQHKTVPDQLAAVSETVTHIAGMIESGWEVVITHGNGPQVGFIQRRSELSLHELHPVPLDYCGADTQGAIGYMFQIALYNEFRRRGMEKRAATVVTEVMVDSKDPAFQNPTKPIGSFMDHETAHVRSEKEGWSIVEDAGRGWRRVVPSPYPQKILQRDAIQTLIDAGFVVIGVGGGGIPVVETESGELIGVEAVIDKDFASAMLANDIHADLLLISTSVEKVALNYRKPDQRWLDRMTIEEAKTYLAEGHFAKGSMEPKIKSILYFLEHGGTQAIITSPENIERALSSQTGTHIGLE